jgi:DNA-binding MarR family transcriptional regulator
MNDLDRIRQVLRNSTYEDALAERLGMNPTDLRCLELVVAEPGLTAGRLAELSDLTTGAVTGVLDRLESRGFIERVDDPADRRRAVIKPTAAADQVRVAAGDLDAELGKLLGGYSPDQRRAILEFLDASAAAVSKGTQKLRASVRGGFIGQSYQAPLSDAQRGRLIFSSGAPRLSLNIAPLGARAAARVIVETSASRLHFDGRARDGQLVGANFNGPLPDVRTSDGVVNIRYRRGALAAVTARGSEIALSDKLPWSIDLDGGLTDLDGSLRDVVLERLEVNGGANHVDLELPRPTGTTIVRVSGVVSDAHFRRPRGVPVRLRVNGGVSQLTFDGKRYRDVDGERRFTSYGSSGTAEGYEIDIRGGASSLQVSSR